MLASHVLPSLNDEFQTLLRVFEMKLLRLNSGKKPGCGRKRTLRLAFALAIASNIGASAFAQSDPSRLPEPPQVVSQSAHRLPLPYPFAEEQVPQTPGAGPRLLHLLGFSANQSGNHPSQPPATPSLAAHATACSEANCPPEAAPSSGVAVVQAAATQEKPTEAETTESLIDIDIPLGLPSPTNEQPQPIVRPLRLTQEPAQLPGTSIPRAQTRKPSIVRNEKTISLKIEPQAEPESSGMPSELPKLQRAVVKQAPRQESLRETPKIELPDAETHFSLNDDDEPTSVDAGAKHEETAGISFHLSGSAAVESSFSDSPLSTPKHANRQDVPKPHLANSSGREQNSRSGSLHLSSSTSTKLVAPPLASTAPKRMQIRIEGSPATPLAANVAPQLASKPAGMPRRTIVPVPAQRTRLENMVQASHASHVVKAVPRPALPFYQDAKAGAKLTVATEDSLAIATKSPVLEFSVEHTDVCQVLRTSDKSVLLLGLKQGSTRIAVVTQDAAGDRSTQIHEVTVGAEETQHAELDQWAVNMSQALTRLYPNSHIEVVALGERLVVQGVAASESDANKILSLVRKVSLIPVVDQLRAKGK